MQLTVLGKSNSWPDAGGACSGYLITDGDFRLLLDCGTGTFAALRRHLSYAEVDAIVLSHLHADHILDLVPYSSALRYSAHAPYPRIRLFGPPGTRALLGRLAAAIDLDDFDATFEIGEYDPDRGLELPPLHLRFCEVPHYVQAFAIELSGAGGRRFTYGADCRYNRALVEFAAGTDLLLVEATYGDAAETATSEEQLLARSDEGHMTALQAGRLGQAAGARRVMVAHFSDEFDAERIRQLAATAFEGEVVVAAGDLSVTV